MFRRRQQTHSAPAPSADVQVVRDTIAHLARPRLSLTKLMLVPQSREQARAFAVIVSAAFEANSILIPSSSVDWSPGSTYGTVEKAWNVRLVPSAVGVEVYLDDQPINEVAKTWFEWMDRAQEAADANEDADETTAQPPGRMPILVRIGKSGAVEEERHIKRGRAPKGFVRAYKLPDGAIVNESGESLRIESNDL